MQFVHVMDNLFHRDSSKSPLANALELHFGQSASLHEGVNNLLEMTQQEIDDLEDEVDVANPNNPHKTIKESHPLSKGDQGIIQVLLNFCV